MVNLCSWTAAANVKRIAFYRRKKPYRVYIYFFIGYYIFSNDDVISKIEKFKYFFLFVALTAATLNVYLFVWSDSQHPLFNNIAKFAAEWFMIIALIGLSKEILNFSSKLTVYMLQRSFAFYILHFIWVVLFQYFMAEFNRNNTVLLYIAPIILAYGATFLCCEIFIRIPFICFFTGIKPINTKKQGMKINDYKK